jgi:hypothetical protein
MNSLVAWLAPRFRLLFLLRYSILTGLLPPLLLVLAQYVNPQLLRGLFVPDTPAQLFNVTWLSLLIAALVNIMLRVVQINAPDRFQDYKVSGGKAPSPGPWRLRWLLLLGIGMPIPIFCSVLITSDPPQRWLEWSSWTFGTPIWLLTVLMVLLGDCAGLLLLLGFTAAQQLLLHPDAVSQNLLPFESWGPLRALKEHPIGWLNRWGDRLARWLSLLGPGYARQVTDPNTGEPVCYPNTDKPILVLAPGHAQGALWFGVAFLAYGLSAVLGYWLPGIFIEGSLFGALFDLLLVVVLVGSLLGALEFLLDYYRIPVLLTLLLAAVVLSSVQDSDHFYQLNPEGKQLVEAPDLDFPTAIANHHLPEVDPETANQGPPKGKHTLVVVTCAGGGIQAAAWTTKVLAGLDEVYGPDFTRSLGLISAVSGGSVGTMHFIVNGDWETDGPPFTPPARARVCAMARRSGLDATGWGVAYPDLVRVFVPFVVPRVADRGWALEETWRRQIAAPGDSSPSDLRLGDWIGPTRRGKMPVVVFNATLAETGERLLISPVLGFPSPKHQAHDPWDFFDLYKEDTPNPRVATVVRLSATFPYISPMCRPLRTEGAPTVDPARDYHVADGGYSDNEGALTALEWLDRLLLYYRQAPSRPFDRVLVIRIQPFPTEEIAHADTRHGWLYEAVGPITTIQNVRVASQAERNSFGFHLLKEASETASSGGDQTAKLARDKAQVRAMESKMNATKLYRGKAGDPSQMKAVEQEHELASKEGVKNERKAIEETQLLVPQAEITWTTFAFPGGERPAPLSWKLTRSEQEAIDTGWEKIKGPQAATGELGEPPLATLDRFFRRVKQ